MDKRRLPKRVKVRTPGKTGPRGRGVKEKEWTDCVTDDLRLVAIGDGEGWKTVVLYPGKWWEW